MKSPTTDRVFRIFCLISALTFWRLEAVAADAVVVDTNGNVGFGTETPSGDLHVLRTAAGDHADLLLQSPSEAWTIRSNAFSGRLAFFINNTSVPFVIDESAPQNLVQFGIPNNQVSINGQLNANGNLVIAGVCTGCDAVFHPDRPPESIEDHAAFMFGNNHLPGVGPTPEGETSINVFRKTTGILQELEKAHIYSHQLHERLLDRDERIEALERAVEELQQRFP